MSTPAPSRGVSEADLLEAIRDASQTVVHLLMPRVAAEGLIAPTFWHLHHLERSGVKHPGELSRLLGITPATCTGSIDQLVERGYVARHPSATDRRQVVLEVTPKGRRTLETVWRGFNASLAEVLATLPPRDLDVTARTLRTITASLRKAAEHRVPEARA